MWLYPGEDLVIEKFGKYAKIAGSIFLVLGIVGIFYPVFTTYATVIFVSWLMLFGGLVAGYFTYLSNPKEWQGWLKSIILIGVALYMLFSPLGGAATLGLLLSIYFFMDSFSGGALASTFYPQKGWLLWALNAFLSFVMGIILVVGWPFSSLYLIGLLVGFSLFFDGLALLSGAKIFSDMTKE